MVIANLEEISAISVDAGLRLHRDLGPGLLESAYELLLSAKLERAGLKVDRQVPININYDNIRIENAFRIDLLVENCLVIEKKSTEKLMPVYAKQLLTYLRLMNMPLGLLMNFGAPMFKGGLRRLVNNHKDFASSRLRANQEFSVP